jgi:uncharacterized GH25 family protein
MEIISDLNSIMETHVQKEKKALMAKGHEIWLEKYGIEDGKVNLALVYGHNMRQDGVGDVARLTPFVYSPNGERFAPLLTRGDDKHLISFTANQNGYYTAIADYGSIIISQTKEGYELGPRSMFKDVIYAGAFHQMAKIIVPMGSPGDFEGKLVHGILEIVPKEVECQLGKEMELQVFYEGKPLVGEEVLVVSKKEGKEMAVGRTDGQGIAQIPILVEGDCMFLVRHRDPTKKVNDAFDESVFVTTLVMEAR